MAISELINAVTPPKVPVNPGNPNEWEQIKNIVGLPLPEDFRDFGIHYGSGVFCDGFVELRNPFFGYGEFVDIESKKIHDLLLPRSAWGRLFNLEIYPSIPGLIPFGLLGDPGLDESGWMCWHASKVLFPWEIYIILRSEKFQPFKMDMTSFVAKLICNEFEEVILQYTFSKQERNFRPHRW